jgi:hypothetical protein
MRVILEDAGDLEHRGKILRQILIDMLEEPEVLHHVEKMSVGRRHVVYFCDLDTEYADMTR